MLRRVHNIIMTIILIDLLQYLFLMSINTRYCDYLYKCCTQCQIEDINVQLSRSCFSSQTEPRWQCFVSIWVYFLFKDQKKKWIMCLLICPCIVLNKRNVVSNMLFVAIWWMHDCISPRRSWRNRKNQCTETTWSKRFDQVVHKSTVYLRSPGKYVSSRL